MKNRKLSDFQIEPEELLLDRPESRPALLEEDSKVEKHINPKRFWILFLFSIIMILIFGSRTFWLDFIKGEYYSKKAQANNVRFYPQAALRGIIYDRNKIALVSNEPIFNLLVVPKFLPKDQIQEFAEIKKLAEILKSDIGELKNKLSGIDKNILDPTILQTNIGTEAVLALEARSEEFPGLLIDKNAVRHYENGPAFFHILGYQGRVSKNDLAGDNYYFLTDSIGTSGLEARYEKELRGIKGKRAVLLDSKGAVLNQVVAEDPLPGNNVALSIDAELQKVLYNSLNVAKLNWNASGAGAVVLNPKNGEVLALVSLPSPDNNSFSQGLSTKDYKKIISDQERPLFNRVISGLYPAGSTIKPIIASAALAENIIDPKTQIDDTLGYITVKNQYNPDIVYVFKDWKAHGFVDIRKAIAVSANVYFYTVGGGYKNIRGLGIEKIDKYLKLFGLGSALGIDLDGEKKGLVPTPAWKKSTKKQEWFTGDTYNVSIGQGDLMVTPLQMASAISVIANGGSLWQPKTVNRIENPNGQLINEFRPKILRDHIVNREKLKIVQEGMRQAVEIGSAHFLNDLPVPVAGKTGTAQFGTHHKTNAWFVGFAPYENPELAVAIVVDGAGEGSSAAVPVAKDIFRWYFSQSNNMVK